MDKTKKADVIGKIIVITLIAVFMVAGIISMFSSSGNSAAGFAGPGGMGGFGSGQTAAATANTITVSVKTIEPETIQKTVVVNGNVASKSEVNMYPDTSGKITRLLKSVGDTVSKGEIIAYVDPSKPGSAYAASPVTATVGGTVTEMNISAGDTVSANTAIAVIGSLDDLEITVHVSEKYSSYLKTGLPAYVTLTSAPGEQFTAEITRVSPVVNKSTRTVEATLKLKSRDAGIKPGMFATVNLVIMQADDTFTVPKSALKTYNDSTTVFIIGDDGTARRVAVTTGITNDSETQITSGLKAGDQVITEGSVTEGSAVKIAGTGTLTAAETAQSAETAPQGKPDAPEKKD
ncbi:efflux RND transporter periplasmic adaptor subunit [Treponema brennaborense]|uniref:Efflux transporter, RND family, MFP subunit n=1 Tax=Treponema brennaborense (strain DSM 12168 / CIP 105900 / DD5/3) TaxID=906968 RepID=F4LJV5_TREBD|nr:efflux RND transporter periplasmic adaptor subunit [Treponema brennaborense]AEE16435.1 efflux transporter, RND family, MFP subunit [Treponema brennaborense DSM 12168]